MNLPGISYHNKYFRSVTNSANGEVSGDTEFHYRQEGDMIWATYAGGSVRLGTLVGLVDQAGKLTFTYQHLNEAGEFMTGRCTSTPELLADGRIRLHESWQWTCKDQTVGQSIIEEIQR